MSPRSRGRPPGRGRSQQPGRSAARRGPRVVAAPGREDIPRHEGELTDCWFDEPVAGSRRSWVLPPAHGTYQGLDLELLDPDDEDERGLLMAALHPEFAAALRSGDDMILDGEPVNPRLHVVMHQVVANQLLADDPPETWQAVQRLAELGYDWHNIMHMIAALVTDDAYRLMTENRPFDPVGYTRRLNELPGDWPPP